VDELENAVKMGGDEVYCGFIPQSIGELFGFDDMISRRQGQIANITSTSVLEAVVAESSKLNTPIALTLNCQYSRSLFPHILSIAEFWAEAGGNAIILSDVALLIALKRKSLPLEYHLSLMANAFNTSTIEFYSELGIHRVVLPRELKYNEISRMTALFPTIGFEAIVLHDRCPFIDGLCGFYHSTSYTPGTITSAPWTLSIETKKKCVYANNLSYAGHGCYLLRNSGRHIQYIQEEPNHLLPECAACQLPILMDAGVRFLKIAGRGLPSPYKAKSVNFIRKAADIWLENTVSKKKKNRIMNLYFYMFGQRCLENQCYYHKGA